MLVELVAISVSKGILKISVKVKSAAFGLESRFTVKESDKWTFNRQERCEHLAQSSIIAFLLVTQKYVR